jgi:hypothetical protein
MSRLQTSKLGLLDDLPNGLPTQENDLATRSMPPAALHAALHPDAFPAFPEPTGVDHVILCVRGGQYGRSDFFIREAKKLVRGISGQVISFTDGKQMGNTLRRSAFAPLLFNHRKGPSINPSECVLAVVEAPAAANFSITPWKVINALRHTFRSELLEHALFPLLVVGEYANTQDRLTREVIQPDGPSLLLREARDSGVDAIAAREATFEEDFRTGLRTILDAKNIVPREVL